MAALEFSLKANYLVSNFFFLTPDQLKTTFFTNDAIRLFPNGSLMLTYDRPREMAQGRLAKAFDASSIFMPSSNCSNHKHASLIF